MRISDWSSDVCSSDLQRKCRYRPKVFTHQPILPNNKSHKRVFTPAGSSSGRKSHDRSAALPPMMERARKPGSVPNDDTIELTSPRPPRSEEHTSELQSLMRNSYAVFCLKKKHRTNIIAATEAIQDKDT